MVFGFLNMRFGKGLLVVVVEVILVLWWFGIVGISLVIIVCYEIRKVYDYLVVNLGGKWYFFWVDLVR